MPACIIGRYRIIACSCLTSEDTHAERQLVVPALLGIESADTHSQSSGETDVIAYDMVTTSESTASLSYVDLATPDTLTFTAPASGDVVVWYQAIVRDPSGTNLAYNILYLDGSQIAGSEGFQYIANVSDNTVTQLVWGLAGLSAGSHTVAIKHHCSSATNIYWRLRSLAVLSAP